MGLILMPNPNKSHPGNASGRRGRPWSLKPQDGTTIIRLEPYTTLPCSIRADTPTGICGKPAQNAYAYPLAETGQWATPGLWKVQPMCRDCTSAAKRVYDK